MYQAQVTSDGLPKDEINAMIKMGKHPNTLSVLAVVENTPNDLPGLLLPLIPPSYTILGNPPSFQTISRDCYPEGISLTLKAAKNILLHISSVCEQLHSKQLTHGDLYAHNILVNDKDHLYLTDFGAAWDYSALEPPAKHRIQALEVCAFGWLVGELQSLINPPNKEMDPLFMRCTLPDLTSRPTFSEIVQLLSV
jgi:serine/threonine protein kinase